VDRLILGQMQQKINALFPQQFTTDPSTLSDGYLAEVEKRIREGTATDQDRMYQVEIEKRKTQLTGSSLSSQENNKYTKNKHGNLTNGKYTVSKEAMVKHVIGGVQGKSMFYPTLDAEAAVLKAAEFADKHNLWDQSNKAKVPVLNTNIGTLGNGQPTNVINVYRNKNGTIHGTPGTPR
jgi:hypothetical protein